MLIRIVILILYLYFVCPSSINAAEELEDFSFFETKIRPVLVDKCYSCHSSEAQEKNKLKGGLFLDTKEASRLGGDSGPAVVPGKIDESLLISALKHEDFEMPPAGKLPANVIADFTRWIELGAPDSRESESEIIHKEIDYKAAAKHWAFQAPQKHESPKVNNNAWPKNNIDRFALAQMEQNKVHPVASAQKRELIRRATFDLIGLPPTIEEVNAFLADESPEAFDKVINRLLKSPHYGERWGRYWLDVARYAEDQAHTFSVSANIHAYQYRDWVIQAMNEDMPYDQFVKMQIAGDLLLDESDDQFDRIAGLGYFGLGAVYYKNSDKAKAIADELDDRIDTLSRGFIALTVSCARCHDHKFDPIPTEDYYSLAGIFSSTKLTKLPLEDKSIVDAYNLSQKIVKEHQDHLKKFLTEQKEILAESHQTDVAKYMIAAWKYQVLKANDSKYSSDTFAKEEELERTWLDRWIKYLDPKNENMKKIAALEKWRKLSDIDNKDTTEDIPNEVTAAANYFQNHLIDILNQRDGKLEKKTGDAIYSSAVLTEKHRMVDIRVDIHDAQELYLVVTDAEDSINSDWASWINPRLTGPAGEMNLTELKWKRASTGWNSIQLNKNAGGQPFKYNDQTFENGIGTHATSVIVYDLPAGYTHFESKGFLDNGSGSVQFRVYTAEPSDIAADEGNEITKEQRDLLKGVFSQSSLFSLKDEELPEHLDEKNKAELTAIENQVKLAEEESPPALLMAHAIQDSNPKDMKVYIRGNPASQGNVAPRRFLRILDGPDRIDFSEGSGRKELADAIANADNPLTARVMVNRVWQHHFGKGIVSSTSNFGLLGERPTHPQLLDSLTVGFIESGWSLKWLHREIMQSALYQASSQHDSHNIEIDADNRWLWRMNRTRLDVESWRDSLLAVSGNLDHEMGGQTVKLSDSNNNRRTVYAKISRHDLDGLLRLFDFPDANVTSAVRSQTTVPQQQLFVLNSDFFIRQAKGLAQRLQTEAEINPDRIRLAYQLLYSRLPSDDELELGTGFLEGEKEPDDKLSVWEQYTQALLGANEFMYLD
ncbi:MAG: DUF1553 domain-containing protein [Pirellulales bacterium]